MNLETNYAVVYPKDTNENQAWLEQAAGLIHTYAQAGLMLDLSVEKLGQLAESDSLVLAVADQKVVGTAAITFEYPDGKKEFGGWAVEKDWQKHGVGLTLLAALVDGLKESQLMAFGNANSGPIFEKLGATKMKHADMHESAFEPCQTCLCKGKTELTDGQKCVDTIYDLTPIILAMASNGSEKA